MEETAKVDTGYIGVIRAAEILDVSVGTVYNWAKSGKLASYKSGARWLFREGDVKALKDELRPHPYIRSKGEFDGISTCT
jgi:excisionase family DNA binding protein